MPVWTSCESDYAGGTVAPDLDRQIPGYDLPDIDVVDLPGFPAGASQTFTVLQPSGTGKWMRVADATVAFDAPGGVRLQGRTGLLGQVRFTGINWSKGQAAVTVFKEHHPLVSYVNLDQNRLAALAGPTGTVNIYLDAPVQQAEETVTLSGIAKGLRSPTHHYTVMIGNSPILDEDSVWDGAGTTPFTIEALRYEPAALMAFESQLSFEPSGLGYKRAIYQVMQMKFDSLRNDVYGMVLDFYNPKYEIATNELGVTVVMPRREQSVLRSGKLPECGVCQNGSTNNHGWTTYLKMKPDHSAFDVALLWTEPSWADDPYWYCEVKNGAASSTNIIVGYPSPRTVQPSLLDVPRFITKLPALGNVHPIEAPFVYQLFDKVGAVALVITAERKLPAIDPRADHTKVVWYVDAGTSGEPIVLPTPPLGITPLHLIGEEAKAQLVVGTLGSHGVEAYRGQMWRRYAKSTMLRVAP